MTRRRQAREIAFRAAYQADVTGDPIDRCLEEILEDLEQPADPETKEFASSLVSTLALHQLEIDSVVSRIAKNWSLSRMAATDRSVIRLAAAELLYHAEVPVRVTLDEAIEIAKKYGMETSGAFVNGILDRLAHDVRPPG
ncbi:MAG: transcription antitermination factor NusB [Candidatus Eisenbacteria bacterium]|uniref:Transcription antitermination protein NusB n=1 Tax=Eiseniibacteriota bacterium TaxID=2212470 RepID=A0A538SSN0_UNCEI|nr:MAG: transcription antitermination factor NusB [Candidatus Eisenbacteria bacterium]TMQ64353.1 MAG: transcription antitermination factor NusB [Candidatus Eisenbacteria bacterium]